MVESHQVHQKPYIVRPVVVLPKFASPHETLIQRRMRHLSKRTQYSLRAMYALARCYGAGPVHISVLSEREAIPKKFLQQIMLSLKRFGLVASKKGKRGGYMLVHPPEQITLATIIRLVEGPIAPLPCASETRFRKCDECREVAKCATRIIMKEVRDAMAEVLERTTLASINRKVDLSSNH